MRLDRFHSEGRRGYAAWPVGLHIGHSRKGVAILWNLTGARSSKLIPLPSQTALAGETLAVEFSSAGVFVSRRPSETSLYA